MKRKRSHFRGKTKPSAPQIPDPWIVMSRPADPGAVETYGVLHVSKPEQAAFIHRAFQQMPKYFDGAGMAIGLLKAVYDAAQFDPPGSQRDIFIRDLREAIELLSTAVEETLAYQCPCCPPGTTVKIVRPWEEGSGHS